MREAGFAVIFALLVMGSTVPPAGNPGSPSGSIDGNALLRQIGKLHPLPPFYSVPIRFEVRLHRPLPLSVPASTILYFRAPDQQAVVITSVPAPIAKSIAHSYSHIDVVPQEWATKYNVTDVTLVEYNGLPAYELDAIPNYKGVTHAVFTLLSRDLSAVRAKWFFSDGSSLQLTARNAQIGAFLLPVHEDLTVDMHDFALDAGGDQAEYDFKSAIPDSVFATSN
jgi:hypothetical protein